MAKKRASSLNRQQQYLLTGAALGLYFGLFFRPVREPSLLIVFGLSALVACGLVVVRLFQKERLSPAEIVRLLLSTYLKSVMLLAVFEGRHWAFDWGGRVGTTLFTTLSGGLYGLWLAVEQRKAKKQHQ